MQDMINWKHPLRNSHELDHLRCKVIKGALTVPHVDTLRSNLHQNYVCCEPNSKFSLKVREEISFKTSMCHLDGVLVIPFNYNEKG